MTKTNKQEDGLFGEDFKVLSIDDLTGKSIETKRISSFTQDNILDEKDKILSHAFIDYTAAKQKLQAYIASEIKEVIQNNEETDKLTSQITVTVRNNLRAEQRQRAKQKGYDL